MRVIVYSACSVHYSVIYFISRWFSGPVCFLRCFPSEFTIQFRGRQWCFTPVKCQCSILIRLRLGYVCYRHFPFKCLATQLTVSLCSRLFPLPVAILSGIPCSLETFKCLSSYFPGGPVSISEFRHYGAT